VTAQIVGWVNVIRRKNQASTNMEVEETKRQAALIQCSRSTATVAAGPQCPHIDRIAAFPTLIRSVKP